MHSEKHRYWKGHQRDLRLQSDEPSPCSPQFSTIVLSSWMFARTERRCLTEERKGRHGPYATSPIMGHMQHLPSWAICDLIMTAYHGFIFIPFNTCFLISCETWTPSTLFFLWLYPFSLGFSVWLSCIDGKNTDQTIEIILQFTRNWGKAAGNC